MPQLFFEFSLLQVWSRDYYVRQGAEGTGTKQSPYGELGRALERALRGDVIHVTEGTYTGKGGSGSFIVRVPNLTIAGGYSADFSARDLFAHKTILQRAQDYKGDLAGLPRAILEGKDGTDHSGLIVDGLVLNGKTRNAYYPSGDPSIRGSWDGVLFATSSPDIIVRNTVFINPFGGGIYQYLESEGRNLLVWKPNDLEDLNNTPDEYSLRESGDNTIKNPNPKPDKDYFSGCANKMLADPVLFDTDSMTAVWTAAGLAGAPSASAKQSWGHAYPVEDLSGMDVRTQAGAHGQKTYPAYQSKEAPAMADSYKEVEFSVFSAENAEVKKMDNLPVEFFAAMGPGQKVFFDHIGSEKDYRCVYLNMPGEKYYTRKCVYGYLLKGSAADKLWNKLSKKRERYNEKGLKIKGRAFNLKSDPYPYPVGIVIDEISVP